MPNKYYLTTPLYYVNSKPHIGHSYTNIAADTLARFKRLTGHEVLFLTGTDEHGQKVAKAAETAGMTPKEFVDKISLTFNDLWKTLNISYDDFIRTTETRHFHAVQTIWKKLSEIKTKGESVLYKNTYDGYYCVTCETFFAEGFIEQEGKNLCPDCKRPLEKMREDNYFLKISEYQDWLIQYIHDHESFILPEMRRNEVLGFLEKSKLRDLCVSRPKSRVSWGIPVNETHVAYVWFDALINYVTACGYEADKAKFKKWWPADVHLIGKDILKYHAVYWPIILHILGVEPPRMIFAHGWWVQGGEKMSKSKGNVIDPAEIVKQYGVDAYRYFLLREAPFGFDGTFSEEALIDRFNHDLANDLGNLLQRTLTMCEKYFNGKIPVGDPLRKFLGDLSFDDAQKAPKVQQNPVIYKTVVYMALGIEDLFRRMPDMMRNLAFSDALAEIWTLINKANKHIEDTAPWILAKQSKHEDLKIVILSLCEVLRIIAQALWPFMPKTGKDIWAQLGIKEDIEKTLFIGNGWGYFKRGGKVAKGAPLFPKIE